LQHCRDMTNYQRPVYSIDAQGNRTDYPTLLSVEDGGYSPVAVARCLHRTTRHRGLYWADACVPEVAKPARLAESYIYSIDGLGNRTDYQTIQDVAADGHNIGSVRKCLCGTLLYYHNRQWAYTSGERSVRTTTHKKIALVATGLDGDTYFASLSDALRAGHQVLSIYNCLRGKSPKHHNLAWRYATPEEIEAHNPVPDHGEPVRIGQIPEVLGFCRFLSFLP